MLSRHEEKYILTYRQYAALVQRARQVLQPDPHGEEYTITSLYYDDPQDTGLYEKLDGLAMHTKFRVRAYGFSDQLIKLERKDKQGIRTHKQSAPITRQQIPLLTEAGSWDRFEPQAAALVQQMQAVAQRPVVSVRYRRNAFYLPGSDLRLTFDRELEALPADPKALFCSDFRGIPVLEAGSVVMEIKYGASLPTFVRQLTRVQAPQLSLSKYALCRER